MKLRQTPNKASDANTSKKPVYDANTICRFTDQPPSFPGKSPTAAEMKMIEKLKEMIKNEKNKWNIS